MKMLEKKQLLSALILSMAMVMSGNIVASEKFPLEEKLQQCEAAFKKSHNGKISQADAVNARSEHRKLTLEILKNLNMRNTEISTKAGETMTNKEIVNNFRVMGRLLEMLAIWHQPTKEPFDDTYY